MKELKFDMLAYYRACYGKIIIPLLGTWLFTSMFLCIFQMKGWIGLMVKGVIIVAIFSVLSFEFLLDKGEKRKIVSILKRS
jgi:hypothetical protein